MAVVIYGNFFVYVGLDSDFGSPLLACWELGLQMWAINDYLGINILHKASQMFLALLSKLTGAGPVFIYLNLLTHLCPLPPCFIPTFPRFLDMWRVLSHDSFSTIWIISSFQWRGDKVKRSINSQLDCAINWGAQKWNFMVIYWKTNINIQIYS